MGGSAIDISTLQSELGRLADKYHARAAYLFGSYARGEARGDSDLDVLIDGGPDFHPSDVFAVAEELYRRFGKQVDVYELGEINDGTEFRSAVMADRLRVA